MSDPTSGTSSILLPQVAAAYQADPRSALVRSLLQQGQQNLTATPTYSTGAALAKALTMALGGISSGYLQGQYQDQNAVAQKSLGDAITAASGTPASTNPDTGEVTAAVAPDFGKATSLLAGNSATSPLALQMMQSRAAMQQQLTNDLLKDNKVIGPNGMQPAPGSTDTLAALTAATEGAKANSQLPAQMALSAFGKGGYLQPDGSISMVPNYSNLVSSIAGQTAGSEANARNASDLNYKPLIAGQTAAAELPYGLATKYLTPQALRPGGALVAPGGDLAQVFATLQQNGLMPKNMAYGGSPLVNALVPPPSAPVTPAAPGPTGSPTSQEVADGLKQLQGGTQQLPPVPPQYAEPPGAPGTASNPGSPPPAATQNAASTLPQPVAAPAAPVHPGGPTVLAYNSTMPGELAKRTADQIAADNEKVMSLQQQNAQIGEIMPRLQSATLGGNAKDWGDVYAAVNGVFPKLLDQTTTSNQVIDKLTTQLAAGATSALGKGEAASVFNTLRAAYPNREMTPEAMKDMLGSIQGLNDFQIAAAQAKHQYALQNGNDPSGFETQSPWMQQNRPISYVAKYLSLPTLKAIQENMLPPPQANQ